MYRQLHEKLHLVVILGLAVGVAAHAGDATQQSPQFDELHASVSKALPRVYSKWFDLAVGEVGGEHFAVVCATPTRPPEKAGRWGAMFLVVFRETKPGVVWSKEYEGDVFCDSPAVFGQGDTARIISITSRPYSGSVAEAHLRVYRMEGITCWPKLLFTAEYVDGGMEVLPNQSGEFPGFLVYEPTYEYWPKLTPQRYAFRLYLPMLGGRHYYLARVVRTVGRHSSKNLAYQESHRAIERNLESSYRFPDRL